MTASALGVLIALSFVVFADVNLIAGALRILSPNRLGIVTIFGSHKRTLLPGPNAVHRLAQIFRVDMALESLDSPPQDVPLSDRSPLGFAARATFHVTAPQRGVFVTKDGRRDMPNALSRHLESTLGRSASPAVLADRDRAAREVLSAAIEETKAWRIRVTALAVKPSLSSPPLRP